MCAKFRDEMTCEVLSLRKNKSVLYKKYLNPILDTGYFALHRALYTSFHHKIWYICRTLIYVFTKQNQISKKLLFFIQTGAYDLGSQSEFLIYLDSH